MKNLETINLELRKLWQELRELNHLSGRKPAKRTREKRRQLLALHRE